MDLLINQYPELRKVLETLNQEQQKKLVLVVSEAAISQTKPHNQRVKELLKKTTLARLSDGETAELEKISQEVEEPYLKALGRDEVIPEGSELKSLFKQARAIQSLADAARGDINHALYEALHAGVSSNFIINYFPES